MTGNIEPVDPAPVTTGHVEARVHGRYLLRTPAGAGPWPLLVGFHGYGENALTHLDALANIPGVERWLVVAVQALHAFYTRDQRVVASWMTREDRHLTIADNVDYVGRVLNAVRRDFPVTDTLVFAGFSQGGAMAYRAAAHHRADAVLVLAADVPPDVAGGGAPLPRVLIGRGTRDEWYTEAKAADDLRVLARRATRVDACLFDAGHAWAPPFYEAAGQLLRELQSAR
jgi:predicted esterase